MNFFFSTSKEWGEEVLVPENNNADIVLPLICYESAFPDFTAQMSRKYRPDLITIHLNEGWYNNMQGARIFQKMAQARAIENRKSIVRSSNRGISDLIDSKGFVVASQTEKIEAGLFAKASINRKGSLFVKQGQALIVMAIYFIYFSLVMLTSLQLAFHFYPQKKPNRVKSNRRKKRQTSLA